MDILRVSDYAIQMKVHNLREIDKEHDMHLQAWLNARVQDTKEQGKKQVPVYKNFEQFYNHKERLLEVEGKREIKVSNHMKTALQMASEINK